MKMQEISLIMSTGGGMPAQTKGTKVSDTTFDSFMNEHASKVSQTEPVQTTDSPKVQTKEAKPAEQTQTAPEENTSGNPKLTSQSGMEKQAMALQSITQEVVKAEMVDVSEMVAQTMVILQDLFQLTEDELVDIMEQMGIQITDLLFQVQPDMVIPVNTDAIQEFVLGVHGVEDPASILINDTLNQEMEQVVQEITEVLSEGFQVEPEQLPQLQETLKADFAEQLEMQMPQKEVEIPVETAEEPEVKAEAMPVIVETEEETSPENQKDSSEFAKSEAEPQTDIRTVQDTPATEHSTATFTENMSKALEHVSHAEEMTAEQTTTQIVEQVIRQVRIRVMPQTTSMELQLNPASLGRVNLTVATTGGVATATMVVENQVAKEALESQMIALKESFAEQGLKVEEVEVTVAEFGLRKQNEQQQQENEGKSNRRRFRLDDELENGEDDEAVAGNMTASERRDVNSVVDYTA